MFEISTTLSATQSVLASEMLSYGKRPANCRALFIRFVNSHASGESQEGPPPYGRHGNRVGGRTRSEQIDRLYPESYLRPMQNGRAVQKLDDAGLDRRRLIVQEHDCCDDHVAAVVEGD